MSDGKVYDADYFLHGKQSGKSLYEDYRWLPHLTIPMCQTITEHCGIDKGSRVLDFGCARGYLVKALRGLGYDAFGYDISKWALDNCDPEVRPFVNWEVGGQPYYKHHVFDWIIAKDVLEHVEFVERTINDLMEVATKGLFVVVPLSKFNGGKYVIEEYEKDVTHCQRFTLRTWTGFFLKVGWRVEASYRLPGVKCNYYKPGWEEGNGFITCKRLEQ